MLEDFGGPDKSYKLRRTIFDSDADPLFKEVASLFLQIVSSNVLRSHGLLADKAGRLLPKIYDKFAKPEKSPSSTAVTESIEDNLEELAEELEVAADQIATIVTGVLHQLPNTGNIKERARSYWYGHIMAAIGSDEYASSYSTTMLTTAEELRSIPSNDDDDDYSEISEIKRLSGMVKESDVMPHDSEITAEEAFAMIKQGRWDTNRFNRWLKSQKVEKFTDDNWIGDKITDDDYPTLK